MGVKSVIKWGISNIAELVAALGLVVALGLAGVNAFTRLLLHYSYSGTDEIICIAFAWAVFSGAAAAYKRRMHYGIDMLVSCLKGRTSQAVGMITQITVTFILCSITYLSWVLTSSAGTKIMTATRIPYTYFDMAMLFGFGLMSVYSVVFLVQDIGRMIRGAEIKEDKDGY